MTRILLLLLVLLTTISVVQAEPAPARRLTPIDVTIMQRSPLDPMPPDGRVPLWYVLYDRPGAEKWLRWR